MDKALSEELRLQFQRHENTIDRIDRKVNSLMTISGIISTVLIGLSDNRFDLSVGYAVFLQNNFFVIASVILMILVVILCVRIYSMHSLLYPFLGRNLSHGDNTVNLSKWTLQSKEMYYKSILNEYIKCLEVGESIISKKTTLFSISMTLFIIGLVLIPVDIFI